MASQSDFLTLDMKLLHPLRDRILVDLDGDDEFAPGGLIVIPEIARYPKPWGTVLAVGPGLTAKGRYQPIPLQPGDRVWLGKLAPFTGLPIELDGGWVVWRNREIENKTSVAIHDFHIELPPCVAYLVYEADVLGLIHPDFDRAMLAATYTLEVFTEGSHEHYDLT